MALKSGNESLYFIVRRCSAVFWPNLAPGPLITMQGRHHFLFDPQNHNLKSGHACRPMKCSRGPQGGARKTSQSTSASSVPTPPASRMKKYLVDCMSRINASGPQIGVPGRSLAGLLLGKHRHRRSGRPSASRRADFGAIAVRPKPGPEGRFPARKQYCVK